MPKKDFKPVVKHLPEFPTQVQLSVPAELTMGPEGEGFIGMTLSDCSVTISEGDEVIGCVEACLGGGIIVRHKRHSYSINLSDVWNAMAIHLPDGPNLLVPFKIRQIAYEKIPAETGKVR